MLSIAFLSVFLSAAAAGTPAMGLCASAASAQEDGRTIPPALLQAIALAESGRANARGAARIAWPWTVTAEQKGRYFPNREAAIRHVRALKARGVRNIDVGCMQINLHYHPKAFDSLEAAFDPDLNAAYAARFLSKLKAETRSVSRAVSHYHSRSSARGRAYWMRVLKAWNETRRRVYQRRLAAARTADKERRERQRASLTRGAPKGAQPLSRRITKLE